MLLSQVRNEFLGCTSAITVYNEHQFNEMKQFMGVEGLFMKDGNIAGQMTCRKYPSTVYRDPQGMYVDIAESDYLKGSHYHIYDFDKVSGSNNVEQMNFFGDEDAAVIKQPDENLFVDPMNEELIEADAKVVKNELSLDEIFKHVEVGIITPAKCDGQLLEYKDMMIECVKKYENILVTKDNYTELKSEIIVKFNNKIKELKEDRAKFNKEVNKFTQPYSDAFSEIVNVIESVIKPLKDNIKQFEEEEKDRQIEEFTKEFILPKLIELLNNKSISEEQVNEFKFNDKWLKKTSTGNLTKATKEGIEAELNRLSELYAQKQRDLETIKSTVETLASAHNVDAESLKADTYIDLYNRGVDMPTVQQRINADLENIKKTIEREKEKARIEAERKQREAVQQENIQKVQNTVVEENALENNSQQDNNRMIDHTDAKTGEVIGKSNNEVVVAKRISTPEQLKDKTYTYTYEFSGDFGSIKTFSNILKMLSKISNFKYTRK